MINKAEILLKRLETLIERNEMLKLSEFLLYAQNWKKRLGEFKHIISD